MVQYKHSIFALDAWTSRTWYTTASPITTRFRHWWRRFDSLGLFFDNFSMGVCITRGLFDMWSTYFCTTSHLETSGRLVAEMNACTVAVRLHAGFPPLSHASLSNCPRKHELGHTLAKTQPLPSASGRNDCKCIYSVNTYLGCHFCDWIILGISCRLMPQNVNIWDSELALNY